MGAAVAKLTVRKLESLTEPGRYGDGDGLWFQVRKPDADRKTQAGEPAQSWLFRYTWQERQRQLGLGPYPLIGLADARRAAQDAAREVRAGRDPIAAKRAKETEAKAQQAAMTFNGVLALYLDAHQDTWRNPKHRAQWTSTLATYASPVFGDWLVQTVDTGAVMKVIEPLWKSKTETASRVRGRIEAVLDYAAARGWRTGDNPARWRGHVENLLPKRSKVAAVEHHAALPWAEMGSFMAALDKQAGTAALALRFTILTAARTGEAIGARWSEIDISGATWVIPAERMKAGREHRCPLTDAALGVLRQMLPARPAAGDGYVFPGQKKNAALSNMAMTALLRRMERGDLTVHGFRSTFRQWAGERTTVAREVAEAALAHSLKDKTEAAYARNDLFDRRRKLMEQWAAFCATVEAPGGAVVPIRRGEAA
jgi:integrase